MTVSRPHSFSQADFILNSPVITNYGRWDDNFEECDGRTFVRSFDVDYDPASVLYPPPNVDTPDGQDNIGLISIAFECVSPYGPPTAVGDVKIVGNPSKSFVAPLKSSCEGFAVGFQLLSAESEIALDNTGANNLRLYCSGLKDSATQYVEGYGDYTGEWSDPQYCKVRQAICGIQIQIQDIKNDNVETDDTGINNVRLKCCDIPSPAMFCDPFDSWELVQECDNLNGTTPYQCTYFRTVGLGTTVNLLDRSDGRSWVDEYYSNIALGFEINSLGETPFWLMQDLATRFASVLTTARSETGHDWGSKMSSEVWNVETSTVVNFMVEPGNRAEIRQIVGHCGYYSVKTPRIKVLNLRRVATAFWEI